MMDDNNLFQSYRDHFLVAMPQITDPFFSESVIYLCDHTQERAMGIMINKPSPIRMEQLFEATHRSVPERFAEQWILMGGPVQIDRGFLLHTPVGAWESSMAVNDDIAVTTSRDLIEEMTDNTPDAVLATIGYCSWAEGQLEEEIAQAQWLVVPASREILFEMPYFRRYDAALGQIGVRPIQLAGDVGHA